MARRDVLIMLSEGQAEYFGIDDERVVYLDLDAMTDKYGSQEYEVGDYAAKIAEVAEYQPGTEAAGKVKRMVIEVLTERMLEKVRVEFMGCEEANDDNAPQAMLSEPYDDEETEE